MTPIILIVILTISLKYNGAPAVCYQGSFGWFGWIERGWGGGVVWWASGPGRQVETGAAGLTWSWLQ